MTGRRPPRHRDRTRTASVMRGEFEMWLSGAKRARHSIRHPIWLCVAGWIGLTAGSAESIAQQLLPADRNEIADQERLSWTLSKFPPQPYMNEIYWRFPTDTPAFFRDSLVQFVARTYYLTRDNFDGSRSQ